MALYLYNSLARQKQAFTPLDPQNVRMYVCGPTVYDFIHIGNARPIVIFDILLRILKATYPKVTYARNITDIDDKIIKAAQDKGVSEADISAHYADALQAHVKALNTLTPTHQPTATSYVPQMITMIQRLIDNGHAYAADGHVLFSVSSYDAYGKLSRRNRDQQIAGARVEVAPYKKDPADFVLWKPSPAGMIGWDSPWGFGRPGWHLECSAMSTDLLGESFDIHGGGSDLMFPHHENEIAQSCCAYHGSHFAKTWMHNGMLMINGEKMSKSLGNFFTVEELLREVPGEALRLALISAQYRQPLDFTKARLSEAKAKLDKWYHALNDILDVPADMSQHCPDIQDALNDDINTPKALVALDALFTRVNSHEGDSAATKGKILNAAALLGILQSAPQDWLQGGSLSISPAQIEALIQDRDHARSVKDYALADRIRDQLDAQGIVLKDRGGKTEWYQK